MEDKKEIIIPDDFTFNNINDNVITLKKKNETKPIIKWNSEKDGVEVKADDYHFIVASMPTSISSNWNDAKYICEKWGGYLPIIEELFVMVKYIKEINQCFKDNGSPVCLLDMGDCYWSSSEFSSSYAHNVDGRNGYVNNYYKFDYAYVRAFLRA